MIKLISLERLQHFWESVKAYFAPKFEALDKRITMQTFVGTQAELQVAIEAGLVDEKTIIVLTDTNETQIYEFCTYADILAMFPQYMTV